MNTNTTTREAAATVLSTKLVLSLSAIPLAALVTACSAGTNPSAPVARSDTVAEAVQNYAGDPGDPYDQDPNTSAEAWTRRLEAIQGTRGYRCPGSDSA